MNQSGHIPAPAPIKNQTGQNMPVQPVKQSVPTSQTPWDLFDFSAAKKQVPFIKLGSLNSKDIKEHPHLSGCIYSSLTKEALGQPGQALLFVILGAQRYISTYIYQGLPLPGRSYIGGNQKALFEKREKAENATVTDLTSYEGQPYGADQTLYRREEVFFSILPVKHQKQAVNTIHLITFSNKGILTAKDLLQKMQAHMTMVSGPDDLLFAIAPEQHTNKAGERYSLLSRVQVTTQNIFKQQFEYTKNKQETGVIFTALEREYTDFNKKAPVQQQVQAVPTLQTPPQQPVPQPVPQQPIPQQQAPMPPQAPVANPFQAVAPKAPTDGSDITGIVSKDEDLGAAFPVTQENTQLKKMEQQANSLFGI